MLNIAIIGAGGIAKSHVGSLQKIPNTKIVGIIDINRERAEAMAATHNAMVYDDPEDCLGEVDLVYVLTPPSSHKELVLKAINAGKHVVCEKPISSSLEDAEIMVQAARTAKVKLIIAFNMRFRKGFRRLKKIFASGELGNLVSFWSQRIGMGVGQGYNWRTDPKLMCGMSIESLSHDIDLIRWIAGDIIDVRANVFESRADLPGFDNNANVVFSLANGSTAIIHASWSSHLGMNSRGIIGTKGTAFVEGPGLWDLKNFHWKTQDMEGEMIEVINDAFDSCSYLEENQHFIDCIVNDLQPTITGEDGLAALRVSQAILESYHKKVVVSVVTTSVV